MAGLSNELDAALPDERITSDLREELRQCQQQLELDDRTIDVPEDVGLAVVAKSFHAYRYDVGMGPHFRALVAIGGVEREEFGIVWAGLCFATLWYGEDGRVRTVDFSVKMP